MTLAGAALREATEESGLAACRWTPFRCTCRGMRVEFCDPRRLGRPPRRQVPGAARDATREPEASEESLDVRWWPVDELPTDEPDMVEMIELGLQRR